MSDQFMAIMAAEMERDFKTLRDQQDANVAAWKRKTLVDGNEPTLPGLFQSMMAGQVDKASILALLALSSWERLE